MMYLQTIDTPMGALQLEATGEGLTAVTLAGDGGSEGDSPNRWTEAAAEQLAAYFAGVRREFSVPLCPEGTAFQRRVWAELRKVPYGEIVTYGALAERVGCGSARAVGGAVGRNPILILIPCHRVLRAGGGLGGFSAGLPKKRFLLNLEKIPYFE